MQRLTNKTCVVTGAARGIGRAIATRFHDEGAKVLVTDIDENEGAATASQIGCQFMPLDVRDENAWATLARVVPTADVVMKDKGITAFEAGMASNDSEHVSHLEGQFSVTGFHSAISTARSLPERLSPMQASPALWCAT
jgi:NAD(P)-dependent dehydrogenase (short-subunit alcohol dehydrogenase family)